LQQHAAPRGGMKEAEIHSTGPGLTVQISETTSLCQVDPKTGIVLRTAAMEDLERKLHVLRPRVLFIDTLAITYGGNEIDRSQVQSFMSGLRRVALASGTAIVLLAHPSRAGMTSGDGASGSTQWSNSARCRMYLRKATDEEKRKYVALHSAPGTPGYEALKQGAEELRVLEEMKNNEATRGAPISLVWRTGAYGFTRAVASEDDAAAARVAGNRSSEVANLALSLVRRYTHENPRPVILDGGRNNAASLFTEEPAAKARAVGKDEFREALQLLYSTGRIRIGQVASGKATRQTIYDSVDPPPNLMIDATTASAAGGPFGSPPPLDVLNPPAPMTPFVLPETTAPAPLNGSHRPSFAAPPPQAAPSPTTPYAEIMVAFGVQPAPSPQPVKMPAPTPAFAIPAAYGGRPFNGEVFNPFASPPIFNPFVQFQASAA
ncbi:MAG: AAA family ATPase, partial [Siculibacillus sp.]|nr:AAA family ATPase [Siculibacillus sp.]